jgi:hypothetical protein
LDLNLRVSLISIFPLTEVPIKAIQSVYLRRYRKKSFGNPRRKRRGSFIIEAGLWSGRRAGEAEIDSNFGRADKESPIITTCWDPSDPRVILTRVNARARAYLIGLFNDSVPYGA